MKKVLLSLCCVLSAVSLFADIPAIEDPASLESEVTAGRFGNEIDDQFSANSAFGSYDQHFIYGGLGNPAKLSADKSHDLGGSTPTTEGSFGYYMPWKFPMSFYAGINVKTTGSNVIIPKMGGKTTEWEANNHAKITKITRTSYDPAPLFKQGDFKFQYLIGLGTGMNIVTGVQFKYTGDKSEFDPKHNMKTVVDNKVTAANSSKTHVKGLSNTSVSAIETNLSIVTNFVSFGAGVGFESPVITPDKSVDSFAFKIPVAFTTGKLDHVAALTIGSDITSRHGYYFYETNNKKVKREVDFSRVEATTDLKFDYDVDMPAADRESDNWSVGATFGLEFKSKNAHARYSYKGVGYEGKNGKYDETYKPGLTLKLAARGARALKFASPKKAVLFNIKPTLELELTTGMTNGAYDKNVRSSASISGSSLSSINGSYKFTGKIEGDKNQYANTTEFTTTVKVPMGLRLMPENWKIGFLLGAEPLVKNVVTVTRDTKNNHKKEKYITSSSTPSGGSSSQTQGGGVYPGTTYDNASTVSSSTWEINEAHYIGITVPFEGGAHLDAKLGGVLLDIKAFTIQAFIPLGTGKKTAAN